MIDKQATVFFVIPLFFLFGSCGIFGHSGKTALMPGTWQSEPIVIDGDSKDWPSPYPNYDSKAMVAYATSNDRKNLYITVESGDQMTQLKILKQGMTVSIDTNGKKSSQLNINYPLQNDNDPLEMADEAGGPKKGSMDHGMDRHMQQNINKNADEANQYALDGFKDCNGGFIITQTAPCGIKVRLRMDEYKELVWEAVVPFKAIYGKDEITAADAGKPISVCFAVKSFKHPESKGGNVENSNGSMNQNMSGMKGSQMHGGGGSRPADNPRQHLYESTKTWKQFGIAFQ